MMRSATRTESLVVVAAIAVVLGALACNSGLPHPPYAAHTSDELVPVPYPPPPARVETVPPKPASGAVWLEGQWSWRGRKWAWREGYWAAPPAGATYSPWQMVRNEEGTLFFAAGTWRDSKGLPAAPPPPLGLGVARGTSVVDPEGESELVGRNLSPDGGTLRRRDAGQ
jgi:hypothetical protein